MRKFLSTLAHFERQKSFWIVLVIALLFIVLRLPSLIEPDWYGDEGIYRTIGISLSKGEVLYRDIWDNKPPLLYWIYAIVPHSLFYPKLLSLFAGLLAVIIFYFFSARLFTSKISSYVSTIFFALLFATPYIEGNIANAENFMLAPILLAFYFLLFVSKSTKMYIFSGVLIGIAFLLKSVALFDICAITTIIVLTQIQTKSSRNIENIVATTKSLLPFFVSFIIPFLIVLVLFIGMGAFKEFITGAYIDNVGYVELGNYFLFPHGLVVFKTIGLFIGVIVLFIFNSRLKNQDRIIYTWLLFSLYSAFFSQRPYMHYLLMLLPSYSLLVGYIISSRKIIFFNLALVLLIWVGVMQIFTPYKKNRGYYENYISYITGRKDTTSYQLFFDGNTPRDYKLANFIKTATKPTDTIFLWSDSAQIYALSDRSPIGRYTTSYHIWPYPDRFEETRRVIENIQPHYIIVTSDAPLGDLILSYQQKYQIDNAKIYERQL